MTKLPRQMLVAPKVARQALADPSSELRQRLNGEWSGEEWAGKRVAVAVGSRGIDRIAEMASTVVEWLRARGAAPFIMPAMGSHGGATPEGQRGVLATYGVTEAAMLRADRGLDGRRRTRRDGVRRARRRVVRRAGRRRRDSHQPREAAHRFRQPGPRQRAAQDVGDWPRQGRRVRSAVIARHPRTGTRP